MNLLARGQFAIGRSKLGPARPCRVLYTPAARTGSKCSSVPSLGLATGTAARRSLHVVASKPSESGNSVPPRFGDNSVHPQVGDNSVPPQVGGQANGPLGTDVRVAGVLMGTAAVALYVVSLYPLVCLAFMIYKRAAMGAVAWAAPGSQLLQAESLGAAAELLAVSLGGGTIMAPAYKALLTVAGSPKAVTLGLFEVFLLAMMGHAVAATAAGICSRSSSVELQLPGPFIALGVWLGHKFRYPGFSIRRTSDTLVQLLVLIGSVMATNRTLCGEVVSALQQAAILAAALLQGAAACVAWLVIAPIKAGLSALTWMLRPAVLQPQRAFGSIINYIFGLFLYWCIRQAVIGLFASTGDKSRSWKPEWWVYPAYPTYVQASDKNQLRKEAHSILQELQDGKLLQGRDYPLGSLAALVKACKDAGGYQVHFKMESEQDSMMRSGIEALLKAVMAQGVSELPTVLGMPPANFVCGLAHALGVPDREAVSLVHEEVALACQIILVTAEAAHSREGTPGLDYSSDNIAGAVRQLAAVLALFPLPQGSAEAQKVGDRSRSWLTMDFRLDFLLSFGEAAGAQQAGVVAELLGFNPEVVVPQLLARLQAEQGGM